MTGVLGLDPLDPQWLVADAGGRAAAGGARPPWSRTCSRSAQEARARRDFATADAVRDRLTAAGVSVEDTPDGPTWSLKDG